MTKDVALMFPGSGSQYVGMARWLYERYPQVRTLFDEASQITERDMAALCLSGTLVQLAEPTAMALAIYTTSVAHFVAWQQFWRKPVSMSTYVICWVIVWANMLR